MTSRSEPSETLSGTKKLFFFTLTLVVLPLLLAFLLAEGYVRLAKDPVDLWEATGRKPGPLPMASWAQLDAFAAFRAQPGRYRVEAEKTVNEYGFISTPSLSVIKPPGTLRVVFLGGSSTAGTGPMSGATFADEETWPWQVISRVRDAFPERQIEFINAALPGYSSFESYGRLWSRVRFFSPDVIVVYHGWNEMYYFTRSREEIISWRTFSDGSWGLEHTDLRIATHRPLWIDHLLRPSQVLTRLRLRFGRISAGEIGTSQAMADHYNPDALEVWRSNLALLRSTAEVMGAALFVVKQATLVTPGLSPELQALNRYEYHGFDHQAHVDAYRQLYRIIDEEFPADRVIDATSLSGQTAFFHDQVHPTAAGAAALTKIVADSLRSYLDTQH